MSTKISFMKETLEQMERDYLIWEEFVLEGPSETWTIVNGKRVLVMCSNNYLGLANHPRLKKAAIEAIEKYGAGSGSVRPIAGTMKIHLELEQEMAKYKRKEASITFQSGFAANMGSIPQLVDQGDLIISDELNHGSIIDGIRLSRAEKRIYGHRDVSSLEKILATEAKKFRRILVVTDGVFSMDGDIAPLPEIVKLCDEYNALLYVDDAHGDGVLGENGRGIANHFHLEDKVDIEMGTFSKAFGCVGGYIVGSKLLCDYLRNKVRPYLLTGSQPPPVAAACLEAIKIVQEDSSLFTKLWDNTRYFKKSLQQMGFDIGQSQTPITPIIIGENKTTKEFSKMLFKEGVFGVPIYYPMVPKGKARIRTIVTAVHTKEDLDFALNTFEKVGKALKVI
ncbi:MAG: glycine C-acetyltransferase [Thermoproteota archaeon]|jgi:glycine C-acetyltransferase|nr:glycine C-acetyltransferase [Thermoproteota archaeon]